MVINNIRIEDHFGLIREVMKSYFLSPSCALTKEDLFQEGVFGLMRAAELYDPSLGAWSTYAYLWVRQCMTRALANFSRTVRAPVHVLADRRKRGESTPAAASLNVEVGKEDARMTWLDMLTYPESEDPERYELDHDRLAQAIETLPSRTQEILRCRYVRDLTLEETAQLFGVTRERIRQIEKAAIETLRSQISDRAA